jgi:two-component system, sensor histidine kinase LadS
VPTNLLGNAVRHSPEGVPVRFQARRRADGGVDFAVEDAGCGIPADEIPKLFQKYFRGRGALDKPGAGLGLYLVVERMAKLHGGTVSVTSSAAGSRFVFTVPGGALSPPG